MLKRKKTFTSLLLLVILMVALTVPANADSLNAFIEKDSCDTYDYGGSNTLHGTVSRWYGLDEYEAYWPSTYYITGYIQDYYNPGYKFGAIPIYEGDDHDDYDLGSTSKTIRSYLENMWAKNVEAYQDIHYNSSNH